MARKSERRVLAGTDHGPRAIVEVEVEVGQHDCALRCARNRRDQAGSRPIAPVEPAMMVGPRRDTSSALISSSIRSAIRFARSMRPRSASQSGQWAKAILRKSRVMRQ